MTLTNRNSSECRALWAGLGARTQEVSAFLGAMEAPVQTWAPALDVVESDTEYLVEMDLPGMTKDEIAIDVMDDILTISGERKRARRAEPGRFGRFERQGGRFSRSVVVPRGFVREGVQAHYQDGVLQVTLPKQKKDLPRPIPVK